MLTAKQIEKLISDYESEIATLTGQLNTEVIEVERTKQLLDEAQLNHEVNLESYDKVKQKFEDAKSLLEFFVKLRNGSNETIRVLRQTSHLNTKSGVNKISWVPSVIHVLTQAKRFMTLGDIFSTIEVLNLVPNPNKKKFTDALGKVLYDYRGTKKLKAYKGKLGLPEWFIDQTDIPKAVYMNEFIYKNND